MSRTAKKKKTRPQLDAVSIASAALAMVDRDGMEGLSFRNLAKVLGCEAMSLYHYFPSKAHLFDAMVNLYLDEMDPVPDEGSWQEKLRFIAHQFRRMALRHPAFFQFVSIYRMNSERGLQFLNVALQIFEEMGLDVETRARNFRAFGFYLTGACLDEALGYAKGPSAAEPVPMEDARRLFPAIMAVGPYFSQQHHERTFNLGIDVLVHHLESEVARAKL